VKQSDVTVGHLCGGVRNIIDSLGTQLEAEADMGDLQQDHGGARTGPQCLLYQPQVGHLQTKKIITWRVIQDLGRKEATGVVPGPRRRQEVALSRHLRYVGLGYSWHRKADCI
jgi:hypothetical protein